MYTLSVEKDFIAQHYLIGGDFGDENELHSHPYRVEVILRGDTLDNHGYLLDITEVEQTLDDLVAFFSDTTLNDLPEFKGLNPSLEHFARIFWEKLVAALPVDQLSGVSVKLWEDANTWVRFTDTM